MQDMLKKAWDAEGSPFKGQPFDPSKVNLQGKQHILHEPLKSTKVFNQFILNIIQVSIAALKINCLKLIIVSKVKYSYQKSQKRLIWKMLYSR